MTVKKTPIFAKILAGMLFGVVAGFFFFKTGHSEIVTEWIKPWGTIFIKLLKMIAIPLIFVSLVKGIGSMNDLKRLSKLGLKTISLYLATTFFAVSLGLTVVSIVKPGSVFTKTESETYRQKYIQNSTVTSNYKLADETKQSPMDFISNLIPENFAAAASDNRNMLQVIFVALLTGIAVVLVGREKTAPFMSIIASTEFIVLKIIDLVMKFAPIGVFALMAALVVDFSGDTAMFSALGKICAYSYLLPAFSNFCFLPSYVEDFYQNKYFSLHKIDISGAVSCFFYKFERGNLTFYHGTSATKVRYFRRNIFICLTHWSNYQYGWYKLLSGYCRAVYCAGIGN